MINEIAEAVIKEEMTFGELDSKIMKFGYKSVCDYDDINMILESGSVVYEYPRSSGEDIEPIEITFTVEGKVNDIDTEIIVTVVEEYF